MAERNSLTQSTTRLADHMLFGSVSISELDAIFARISGRLP
ncbi:MAG TPA: hypothetical protein VI585_02400 [Candidatus Binatia bacterium]